MDNQRLILLLVFLFSLFMLWDGWQKQNQPVPSASQNSPAQQVATQAGAATPTPTTTLPSKKTTETPVVPGTWEAVTAAAKKVSVKTDLYMAEISAIRNALIRNGGNISKAAQDLDVSRPTLHDLIKKHGIAVPK